MSLFSLALSRCYAGVSRPLARMSEWKQGIHWEAGVVSQAREIGLGPACGCGELAVFSSAGIEAQDLEVLINQCAI